MKSVYKDGKIKYFSLADDVLEINAKDGTIIYIEDLKTFYEFDGNSNMIVDGLKCVKGYGDLGRWLGFAGQHSLYSSGGSFNRVEYIGGSFVRDPSPEAENVLYISDDEEDGGFTIQAEPVSGTKITLYPQWGNASIVASGCALRDKGGKLFSYYEVKLRTVVVLTYIDGGWIILDSSSYSSLSGLFDCDIVKEFDDWFLPSLEELKLASITLKSLDLSSSYNSGYYMSSTEYSATQYLGIYLGTDSQSVNLKNVTMHMLPIRSFTSLYYTYRVGDVGPAGGYVFYKNGYSYLEVKGSASSNKYFWCDSGAASTLIGTSGALLQGRVNTTAMLENPMYLWGAAEAVTSLKETRNPKVFDVLQFNGDKWISVSPGKANVTDYSYDEIYTGKLWLDGKKIYRRCFVGTTDAALSSFISLDLAVSTICPDRNFCIDSADRGWIYAGMGSSDLRVCFEDGHQEVLEIFYDSPTMKNRSYFLVLEYTKA